MSTSSRRLKGTTPTLPAGRRGRSDSSKERWQGILEAAERVIHVKGFPATTIQDIADEVQLLKGSLYYYIQSKDDLLDAIIRDFFSVWRGAFREIRDSGGDPLTKLRELIRRDIIVDGENAIKAVIFFRDANWVSAELRAEIIAERDAHARFIQDLLEQGQFEGMIRWDVNPKAMALAISTLSEVHTWFRADGGWGIEYIADQYVDLVMTGLTVGVVGPSPRSAGTGAG
jgi:TetR/AcrR family transcriptional regulator, cholesterol catabolism regulator